jgi:hypothetical protein
MNQHRTIEKTGEKHENDILYAVLSTISAPVHNDIKHLWPTKPVGL